MTAPEPESGTAPAALRALAEQLATEAAAFVRRRRSEVFAGAQQDDGAVRTKSSPTDPVTVVDTDSASLISRSGSEPTRSGAAHSIITPVAEMFLRRTGVL